MLLHPFALVFAASFLSAAVTASAVAADKLGTECCADLEERIKELESVAADAGTRKVKLTIAGFLNEAIMFWNDGVESNSNIVTNDNGRGRFQFRGVGKIDKEWSAGFRLELGVRIENSKRFTQSTIGTGGFDIRHALWFIESKKYGRISVGNTGGAGEGATEMNLSRTFDVAKYSDPEDVALGLILRRKDGTLVRQGAAATSAGIPWYRLLRDYGDQAGEGRRSDMIRYETPDFKGFIGIANWGMDDAWELGLRYRGEMDGFRLAAAMVYGENTTTRPAVGGYAFACLAEGGAPGASGNESCSQFGASASLMHDPTGLYANLAYGTATDDIIGLTNQFRNVAGVEEETWFWATELGLQRKFFPIGSTTFFGQYYYDEGGSNARRTVFENNAVSRILDTGYSYWGGGVVQFVEDAALELYLYYRHSTAEMTALSGTRGAGTVREIDLEDLDVVTAGGLIRF